MNCNEINDLINEYFDNNTSKTEDNSIFLHLAECENCRAYFKNMALMQSSIQQNLEAFPAETDTKIFAMLNNDTEDKFSLKGFLNFPIPLRTSFACALGILLIMSLMYIYSTFQLQSEIKVCKEIITNNTEEISTQNARIEGLMRSIRPVEVKATYVEPTTKIEIGKVRNL